MGKDKDSYEEGYEAGQEWHDDAHDASTRTG